MFERIGWKAKWSSDQKTECSTKIRSSCLNPIKQRKGTRTEDSKWPKIYSSIDSRKKSTSKVSRRKRYVKQGTSWFVLDERKRIPKINLRFKKRQSTVRTETLEWD
jgi:hypothetical protein